jgi:hydrogenase-1 operon protein HyaE
MTLTVISGGLTLAALCERLAECGYAEVDDTTLDALAARSPWLVVLPLDNPAQRPEFADLLVILPEILRQPGLQAFSVAFARPPASAALVRRFGVQRHPALVVLRHGALVGVIDGLRDWADYVQTFTRLREAPLPGSPGADAAAPGGTAP